MRRDLAVGGGRFADQQPCADAPLLVVPAAQAGVFTVMLPVSAAVVGVIFLGESLSGMQLVAFLAALAGVVLATARPATAPSPS